MLAEALARPDAGLLQQGFDFTLGLYVLDQGSASVLLPQGWR
jgi:hypothetical protein